MSLLDRFLRYVKIDTQSDPYSTTTPSTMKQKNLGKLLVEELQELGVSDAYMDEYGYVYGTIKGNVEGKTLGLIAHMDTSPDVTGENVNPRIIENYDGEDIILNESVTTRVSDFPFLKNFVGKTLVVTDGNTLLGADDKAGVVEIMSVVEYLSNNPDTKHSTIKICFTPDEEIGRGTDEFDVEGFAADFAYTIDGATVGDIDYENFNAGSTDVIVKGVNIHPGSAKDKMINANNIAMEFHGLLPVSMRPEHTIDREGFNHLNNMSGNVEEVKLHYIIRNHDLEGYYSQKQSFVDAKDYINRKYGKDLVSLNQEDSYFNMYEKVKENMWIVDIAKEAIEKVGLTPASNPIRGGTDGAMLTYKGLVCPNLGTGGFNFHGKNEFCVVEEMEKSVEIILEIIKSIPSYDFN